MKYPIRKFKSLAAALKELEPFIRNGKHLQTGKPFKKFGDMRSREILANWLTCVAVNSTLEPERLIFTSDPVGGDGVIYDTKTEETWRTEHVMVPDIFGKKAQNIEDEILKKVTQKQKKGGKAYAWGKTLIVFLNAGSNGAWNSTNVAKKMPVLDFEAVWVVGLHGVEGGQYVYNVTRLDLRRGNPPVWQVRINEDFEGWEVSPVQ